MKDPIVEEVSPARVESAALNSRDPRRIFEDARSRQGSDGHHSSCDPADAKARTSQCNTGFAACAEPPQEPVPDSQARRHYTLDGPETGFQIDFAGDLNEEQHAAVTSPPGPALVIAGAGSGKTRTLTYRVAWLLAQGVPAGSILLLTFTNKASREMLERVRALVPGGGDGVWGGTFHSIGNRILRVHAERIGFRRGFTIMDREDQEDLLASVLAREGLSSRDRPFPKAGVLADVFSYAVSTGATIRKVLGEKFRYFIPFEMDIERVQGLYEAAKKEANAMDFDDLLCKTLELFLTNEDVAAQYQHQFRHVLVDEYQDTNLIQADLVDRLAARHGSIMVVGDDAQSIYSWRGANCENILKFPERHAGTKVFKIETNYRSVPEVLDLANAAILANENQFHKNLSPVRLSHPLRPALVCLATSTQQAAFVAQRIRELHDEGVGLHEMAVLYRAHYHSMEIQMELTRREIPFAITSGLRFFEQAHIKDVAAFLKFATNPRDEVAFKRMARLLPGIGAKTAENLWAQTLAALARGTGIPGLLALKVPAKASKDWAQLVHTLSDLVPAAGPLPPAAMIECVLFAFYDDHMKEKFANYDARSEDLATFAEFAREFTATGDFLSELALLGGVETADAFAGDSGKVTLSSLHQAKGLEWRVVFLIWLADGMFPTARSLGNPEAIEEERRLFYVGITRCKDELYLAYPELSRNAGGATNFQRPSRFLSELPENLMETWNVGPPARGGQSGDEEEIPF
ncbi:MAG: ATP-dependent helicase [Verrucomicrobiae bacterium]